MPLRVILRLSQPGLQQASFSLTIAITVVNYYIELSIIILIVVNYIDAVLLPRCVCFSIGCLYCFILFEVTHIAGFYLEVFFCFFCTFTI